MFKEFDMGESTEYVIKTIDDIKEDTKEVRDHTQHIKEQLARIDERQKAHEGNTAIHTSTMSKNVAAAIGAGVAAFFAYLTSKFS